MKKKESIVRFAALFGALLVFASCNNNQTDSKRVAEASNQAKFDTKAGEKNAEFMVNTVASNSAEVSLSELALERATNPEVKKIAGMLKEDHTAMLTQLKTMAEEKAITVPMDLTDESRKEYNNLNEKKSIDFDKAWTKKMVDKHTAGIEKYETALKRITDESMKQWIGSILPKVRMHLDSLKMVYEKVK